ncbi:acyl-CoA dehydrogenase [Streptomyces sp. ME02-8801-2C]|uniref:acyl-CoA dehydrogenase n=1 Tax=Streptomyces sp. ME02-8801-2C TaxID=3028680 RepID=UPI0029A70592|nr:acyl-CoA dehydrogenase [Streptomyces sp. ME02-8801-2C]MDX3456519.1 acyl-CoA dehydrogenase [Streptomyces sp. ME02-8801-2C]
MPKSDLTELAGRLERDLGDPHDPSSRMPYTRVLEHDEQEDHPTEFVHLLQRWGALDYSLPRAQGGKAGDVEIGFNLMRLIARRDPTTATAFVITSLSFMPAWVAGTDAQKRALVDSIRRGNRFAWGLSEIRHGSDLPADEMTAEKTDGGYLLTGEKWLVGNSSVTGGLSIYARTDPRGGPGGYSVFVLDRQQTPAGAVNELPRERMHGLRGLDMSGFRLDRVFVPDSARLGREGQGLEIALKTAQTAHTLVSGIALSAVDTGLRGILDFTEGRTVLGRKVRETPYSRRQLTECFADLMVADAVSLGAVRALQVVPEHTGVWSSVVKYFVPTLLERTYAQLNVVLGASFYLRGHPQYAIHQKMLRDLSVATFADGNTAVNLRNIALQLDGLLATATTADQDLLDEADARAAVLFGIDRQLPLYRPWDQELNSRGRDDALLAAPTALVRLRRLAAEARPDERDRLTRAADTAAQLLAGAASLRERVTSLKASLGRDYGQSAEFFDLAKEYCLLHAAAACVHTYVHSAAALEEPLPSGALLLLQMERVRRHLRPHEAVTDAGVVNDVMRVLRRLHLENRLFSYWQFPLAERGDLRAAGL